MNENKPRTRTSIVKVPITMAMKEVEEERRLVRGPQCCEPYGSRTSIRFCERRLNHDGDHRADRVQWRTEQVTMTPIEERRQRRAVSDAITHLVGRMAAKGSA